MDVDADNFETALRLLDEHIPKASFVSIDLEMTGISGPPELQVCQGDVPQVQYSKACKVIAQPLNIVQVGICLFEEQKPGHFDCRPFNVFVFPRAFQERDAKGNQVKSDPFLGLSASSAAFLAEHGLDFQRWVTKGVSYVDASLESKLLGAMPPERKKLKASRANENTDDSGHGAVASKGKERVEPTRQQDIDLLEETMKQVEAFMASGASEMKLPDVNRFMALVFRQRIEERFPELVVEKRPSETNPHREERWVLNMSDERQQAWDDGIRHRLLTRIGVRRMWNSLKAAKKPVVFHNGFMDLLFLVSAFEKQLPSNLLEFKELLTAAFPNVFDTKVLAESAELSGRLSARSALGDLAAGLVECLRKPRCSGNEAMLEGSNSSEQTERNDATDVCFTLASGFELYADGEGKAFHTAGYDAYETGRIFAYYSNLLGPEKLHGFRNRIHLMFSAFELRLGNSDSCVYGGIVRHLRDVNRAMLNNRGLSELLKPLTEDGKRKVAFRWCGDGESLLLILHGSEDTKPGHPGRAALEACLDSTLIQQAEQQRLQFVTLEAHIQELTAAAESTTQTDEVNGESRKRKREDC